ncbi:MAG: hypothetical protein ACR2Q3_10460 [Woeseiaceae bacterium]
MNRLTIVVLAIAVIVGSVLLSSVNSGSSGSFQFHYTSPISALLSTYLGGTSTQECEYLAKDLFDLEIAATEIGVSRKQLTHRLEIDTYPPDALAPDCRVTFRGESGSDTMIGLRILVVEFVKGMSRKAQDERTVLTKFLQETRAEITQRRALAQSSNGKPASDRKRWKITGDVESWTAVEYEEVLEQLNQALTTVDENPSEVACIEFLDWLDKQPTDHSRALEAQCRDSKPIGITQWPQLAETDR